MTKDATNDDALAFEEAMRGARRLAGSRGRLAAGPAPDPMPGARSAARPANAHTMPLDADGPITSASFTIAVAGERIEARASGVDARTARRLRSGEPRAEARLDLHGCSREAALKALERFVHSSRGGGRRALLVIHGRGSHAQDGRPVLKPLVWRWLASSRAATAAVLAFTSAPPTQGGDGATLVLLRKPDR